MPKSGEILATHLSPAVRELLVLGDEARIPVDAARPLD